MPRLRASDYGRVLPTLDELDYGEFGRRQEVLLETIARIEERNDDFHALAHANVSRWKADAKPARRPAPGVCAVRVYLHSGSNP
jgi:hypothetical protein